MRVERSLEEVGGVLRLKPPKTKAGWRTIRIASRTVAALANHKDRMTAEGRDTEQGPVFVTSRGTMWHKPNFYRRVWCAVLKAAGLRHLKPHGLRHTSATLLLSSGASVRMVSARLGHEDIGITLAFYAKVLPDDQEQAVGIWERLLQPSKSHSCPTDPTSDCQQKKQKQAQPA